MKYRKGDIVAVKHCNVGDNGLMGVGWKAAVYDHPGEGSTHIVFYLPSTADFWSVCKPEEAVEGVDILPATAKWPWLKGYRLMMEYSS